VTQTTSAAMPPPSRISAGRDHLRHDRPHAGERHGGRSPGAAQEVPAADDVAPAGLELLALLGRPREPLVQRPGGQAQVGRLAAAAAELGHRVQQAPLEVLGEGRLPRHHAGLGHADGRRGDGLVRAALGRERDPRRGADEDALAPGVDPERPRLERPGDERVVDRPDRDERLALGRVGGAELPEQAHEARLRDPQLDVAAVVALPPAHERGRVVREPVDPVPERPHADAVDPAAEVRGGGHVGAHGHHPRRGLRGLVGQVGQAAPERLLRGQAPGVAAPERRGHGGGRRGRALGPRQALGRRGAQQRLGGAVVEAAPGILGSAPSVPRAPATRPP
jgi:hypothetical protein